MKIEFDVQSYIGRGFGSMNKNDFEVWIIHELQKDPKLKAMSNYKLSAALRIPESKVKRLRYEADLKYPSENDFFEELIRVLSIAHLKNDGKSVQFVIEDISLRKKLDSILKADGRFSDSSFNSEIVSISLDDLEFLLKASKEGEKKINEIMAKANKNNNKITFKDILLKMAEGASEEFGKSLVGLIVKGVIPAVIKTIL